MWQQFWNQSIQQSVQPRRLEGTIYDANDEDDNHRDISCGKVLIRNYDMTHDHCEGDDCHRRYMMYVPTLVCQENGDATATTTNATANTVDVVGTLPLVFTIHCLGCSLQSLQHWSELAELYHFVWVNPEGIHHSFNAGNNESCCGYALQQGLDDVGFLRGIIDELTSSYASSLVSKDWVYAMGWSNGGYMVTTAASLFRAIAPISGYQIQSFQVDHPTGLFLHHAIDDRFVRPTGCCTNRTMPQCCCRLSDYADQCTSVENHVATWATQFNGCDENDVPIVSWEVPNEFTCYTYSNNNCQANTTYCLHQHKGHFNIPNFAQAFPMDHPVANFFAHHMCTNANHGTWDTKKRICLCNQNQQQQHYYSKRTYCFHHYDGTLDHYFSEPSSGTFQTKTEVHGITLSGVGEIIITLIGILVLALLFWIRHQKQSGTMHEKKLQEQEDQEESIELIPNVEMR